MFHANSKIDQCFSTFLCCGLYEIFVVSILMIFVFPWLSCWLNRKSHFQQKWTFLVYVALIFVFLLIITLISPCFFVLNSSGISFLLYGNNRIKGPTFSYTLYNCNSVCFSYLIFIELVVFSSFAVFKLFCRIQKNLFCFYVIKCFLKTKIYMVLLICPIKRCTTNYFPLALVCP